MVRVLPLFKVGIDGRLAGVLVLAALLRLPQIAAPLAENLQAKQVYVANKARSIARPPLNVFRNTLDFLDDRGDRMALTEEVPLYTGLLALAYRLVGEHDWVGRALSLLGTLAAIAAYADLTRREYGPRISLAGAFLLAVAPLLIFYGRAVMPDSWMLATMLVTAACYRRHLDGQGAGWLIGAACSAALAPLFKYYGVMILIPLAGMTVYGKGLPGRRMTRFLIICTATLVPVGLWICSVFLRTVNPVTSGWTREGLIMPYLVFQAPQILLYPGFYYRCFILRFLFFDCGPVTSSLVLLGVVTVLKGRLGVSDARRPLQPLFCWSVMGLIFFILFAPKLNDHDYYELMLLPAAATWGAMGLSRITERYSRPAQRVALPFGLLMLALVVQSPWWMSDSFRIDRGKLILAARLKAWTDQGSRVVLVGPGIELPTTVHYCGREGWVVRTSLLPDNWPARLENFRAAGAQSLALYFDPTAPAESRRSLEAITRDLPVLERGTGPWSRSHGMCSYWILDLQRSNDNELLERRQGKPSPLSAARSEAGRFIGAAAGVLAGERPEHVRLPILGIGVIRRIGGVCLPRRPGGE